MKGLRLLVLHGGSRLPAVPISTPHLSLVFACPLSRAVATSLFLRPLPRPPLDACFLGIALAACRVRGQTSSQACRMHAKSGGIAEKFRRFSVCR